MKTKLTSIVLVAFLLMLVGCGKKSPADPKQTLLDLRQALRDGDGAAFAACMTYDGERAALVTPLYEYSRGAYVLAQAAARAYADGPDYVAGHFVFLSPYAGLLAADESKITSAVDGERATATLPNGEVFHLALNDKHWKILPDKRAPAGDAIPEAVAAQLGLAKVYLEFAGQAGGELTCAEFESQLFPAMDAAVVAALDK